MLLERDRRSAKIEIENAKKEGGSTLTLAFVRAWSSAPCCICAWLCGCCCAEVVTAWCDRVQMAVDVDRVSTSCAAHMR